MVQHVIETTGRPVFARSCRLDPDKLKTAKQEFCKLELAGIIRRSDSPWASPLHMVKKSDSTWRPCGDYRRLNNITTPDRYPLPNMQDLGHKLASCRVFSHLDLVKVTTRYQLLMLMCLKPQSSPRLACTNICTCPSG